MTTREKTGTGKGGAVGVSSWPGWTAVVFLAALALYLRTAAPDFLFDDNSEFIAASHVLGVTHAPGYPLFSLAGKIFSFLMPTEPGFSVNMVSAFAGAAAVAVAFRLLIALTGWWAPALLGAAMIAVSKTFWGQAGQAEVYALNLLFTFLILLLAAGLRGDRSDARRVAAMAALCVVASVNHYTALLVTAVCVVYVAFLFRRRVALALRWAVPLVFLALLAASIVAYLPLRSAAEPALFWNDQSTAQGFIEHLKGVDTRSEVVRVGLAEKMKFVLDYVRLVASQWSPFLLLLLPLGIIGALARRRREFGALLIGLWFVLAGGFILLLNFLYGPRASYVISVFHVTSISLIAVFVALGANSLLRAVRGWSLPWIPVFAILSVLTVYSGLMNRETTDHSTNTLASNYGENLLRNVARDGIIFTLLETESFPIACIRAAWGARRDILLFGRQGDRTNRVFPMTQLMEEDDDSDTVSKAERIVMKHTWRKRPVYFTFRRKLSSPGAALHSNGLLYQMNPYLKGLAQHDPWDRVDMAGIDLSKDYDYITRNVIGKYYVRKGERLLEEGKGEKAQSVFEEILEFNPGSRFLHNDVATLYTSIGQFELARREYEAALATDPENVELSVDTIAIYNNLSYVYGRLGMQPEALETLEKVVELDPDSALLLVNLGQTYWHMEKFLEATETLEKAVKLGAGTAQIYNIMALSYEKLRLYPEAEKNYELAIASAPDAPDAYKDYGIYNAYVANHRERAIELLSTYVRLAPDAPDAPEIKVNLGFMHKSAGRHEEAIEEFNDALMLGAGNTPRRVAIIMGALAACYEQTGHAGIAAESFEQAIRNASQYPEVYREYGKFLARSGNDPDGAIELLKHYLASTPDAADAPSVKEIITRLKSEMNK